MRPHVVAGLTAFLTALLATADDLRLLIGALTVAYVLLLFLALAQWFRRPRSRYLPRWAWLAVIVVFSLIGPAAYLLLGREEGGL